MPLAWLGGNLAMLAGALAGALAALALLPAAAAADGPVTPTATNYVGRVTHSPAGIEARVTNAYLNLWVQVRPGAHVTVYDYRGAPWVRFRPGSVAINRNSQQYYLSQTPVPAVPPAGLTRTTPPHWITVSHGRAYQWREGRLHALATVALAPGQSFAGHWRIPVSVDGRRGEITGGIWYRGAPSVLWFWPVLVLIACALAAWRVGSPALDRRLSRGLALSLLALVAIGIGAKYLHGSPNVSTGNVVLLLLTLLVLGALAGRLLGARPGGALLLATAAIALWAGLTLLPVLTHGYALVALPIFLVRVIAAVLLGGACALALFGVRMLDRVAA
ncbi:MAG: hypothetical protein FWD04_05495 [Conexibacteraceae bacterium]|nr:hypothetical protein [Conexibacteraceae bacterium]